jgi:hypothetical protein
MTTIDPTRVESFPAQRARSLPNSPPIAQTNWTCPFSTTLERFRSYGGESEVHVPRTRQLTRRS